MVSQMLRPYSTGGRITVTSRKIELLATSEQDVPEHYCQHGISNATTNDDG